MMELLEHRNTSDVEGSLMQRTLELGVSDLPNVGETRTYGCQGKAGSLGLDMNPERLEGEGMEEGQAGPLQLFHPREATEDRASSVVVGEALRCQVKITTRRSLHLRIANHTARDVYVRLVGQGRSITGTNTGHQTNSLQQSKRVEKAKIYQDVYEVAFDEAYFSILALSLLKCTFSKNIVQAYLFVQYDTVLNISNYSPAKIYAH